MRARTFGFAMRLIRPVIGPCLTHLAGTVHTGREMQLSFNNGAAIEPRPLAQEEAKPLRLADLREGDTAVIESIDLPGELSHRLMELGFLPGSPVTAARSAPGGDPRVFRIDGTEIALRKETAARLIVKL